MNDSERRAVPAVASVVAKLVLRKEMKMKIAMMKTTTTRTSSSLRIAESTSLIDRASDFRSLAISLTQSSASSKFTSPLPSYNQTHPNRGLPCRKGALLPALLPCSQELHKSRQYEGLPPPHSQNYTTTVWQD